VKSGVNTVGSNGCDSPPIAIGERGSQLVLTDGMRAGVGPNIAEAQHIQRSVGLRHRCQARRVSGSFVGVEGVKQSGAKHCLELASQPLERERVGGEVDLDPGSQALVPAIASAVSATSTPTTSALSPVPQHASSTAPVNGPF
jgi:hypothetical protein